MTDTDPLRVGLLGFGAGGAVFHAPLITATPGMELAAIVTANPERRQQARSLYPGARIVPSAEELWRYADGLDLAVITTPNRTHVPLAHAALAAGVAVVVDKPVARTAAQAQELADSARQHGLLLTVFQNRRWDGDYRTVRRLVASGELGQVNRFESRYERWRPTPKTGWRELGDAEEAGGLLYDLGSHLIDQALWLFGPVAGVYAEVDRRRPGVHVDDDVFVALTHHGGVRSHLWMSAVTGQPGPRFRVLGDKATYTTFGMDPQEEALRAGGHPGDPGWGAVPVNQHGLLGAGDTPRRVPTEPGTYQVFYPEVAKALRAGGPAPVDIADAIAALEVIEAAQRSAETGTTQHL